MAKEVKEIKGMTAGSGVAFDKEAEKAAQSARLSKAKTALLAHKEKLCQKAQDIRAKAEKMVQKKTAEMDAVLLLIDNADKMLADVEKGVMPAKLPERRGRPIGSKNKPKVGSGKRRGRPPGVKNANNNGPLREYVVNVLKGHKSGLDLVETVIAIRKAGYKSNTAGKFSNIVNSVLHSLRSDNKVVKSEDKKYKLVA